MRQTTRSAWPAQSRSSLSAVVALTVLCAMPTLSLAAVRCGDRIINRGSSSAEVMAFCGKPAQVDRSTSYIGGATRSPGERNEAAGATTEIQVEIRTYNFGPDALMERLRFENGIVVDIQTLGYGYNEP